jgi:beta-galactosidase
MKKYLCFQWKYMPGFLGNYLNEGLPGSASLVDLPHAPVETPANYFDETSYQGFFTYEKRFDFQKSGEKVFLCFEGVMLKVHPYLNGVDLGEQISGWVEVRYDVSEIIKEKDNHLLVVVDSNEDPKVPPFGKAVDYLTFAGIYRPVYLESVPKDFIESVHISAKASGQLNIKAKIHGDEKACELSYDLFFGGKLVKSFAVDSVLVPNPSLWNVESPNLYTLRVKLKGPSGIDEKTYRFGFRDAGFTTKGFFLNGKRIELVGLNRHQNYPYVGPAMPDSAQVDDADILKLKLGCNVVRTSHYPDSESFLSRCDELGLMLIDEVPGWQYIGKDKAWRDNFQYFLEKMVEKERNHPCLIAYGTRIDESPDDDELYEKAVNFIHQNDPDRQCLGVRNFKTSHCLEDIYAYNDFSCASTSHGLDDPKTIRGAKKKPILISEHNGHMFPTKQFDEPAKRLEQALRHLRVIDDSYKYECIAGSIGWCAFDYNTHKDFGSGDHICYHGVSDIYRNPKAAAFAYASQHSATPVMWIANPPTPGDYDEALLKPLYVFTNCDYVEMYRNGSFIEVFKPDRKDFPHLPHPPIVIDDFIGALFEKEGYSKKDSVILREALNLVGQNGLAHIKKSQFLKYIPCILRNHMNMEKMLSLYYKYMSGWGEKAIVYNFKGYRDGKKVCEKSYGPSTSFSYRFETYSQSLLNDSTYDVSRVSIKLVDEWGSQIHYANNVISFETKGPIKVIGPTTVALSGGDISVYVRSLAVSRPSEARLIIKTDKGDYPIDFNVQ